MKKDDDKCIEVFVVNKDFIGTPPSDADPVSPEHFPLEKPWVCLPEMIPINEITTLANKILYFRPDDS